MGYAGDQSADRDIFNVQEGTVNVYNQAPAPLVDVTLNDQPPPYHHWQPRPEEQQILADLTTNVQLIQVLGVGGYGKTALATRVFEQASGFDKRLWISFRPLLTADQVPPFREFGRWFGRTFGYQTPTDWTDEQLATEALNRLARQRCLIVLDNLEALLEPDGQWRDLGYRSFLLQWFSTGGRGVLVITSRERPNLPANTLSQTRSYSIGGLSPEAGVALMRVQQVQGSEPELKEYVVAADGHPLLLNLTVGFLKQTAGDSPSIAALKRAEFNLFEAVGLHRGDPDTSIEIILTESLRRLDQDLLGVLFSVWAFPMPFTQRLLEIARGLTMTEAQLRQLAKYSLLQETYRTEGWTFQLQPLIRSYLQQKTLEIYRANQDHLGEANTLKAIGDVLQFLDRRTEALQNYEQAIGIYREVGDRLGEANTLKAIGDVLQFLKRSTEALQNYEQAIGIYREVGDRLGEANVLQEYGKLQEDAAQKLNYLEQSQQIYEQIGDKYSQSRNLLFVAEAQSQLNQPNRAIEALTRASAIAAAIEYEPFQTYANDQIEAILHPNSSPKWQFRLAFFRRGWGRFVLLGLVAFILVLIVKLIFFS